MRIRLKVSLRMAKPKFGTFRCARGRRSRVHRSNIPVKRMSLRWAMSRCQIQMITGRNRAGVWDPVAFRRSFFIDQDRGVSEDARLQGGTCFLPSALGAEQRTQAAN